VPVHYGLGELNASSSTGKIHIYIYIEALPPRGGGSAECPKRTRRE